MSGEWLADAAHDSPAGTLLALGEIGIALQRGRPAYGVNGIGGYQDEGPDEEVERLWQSGSASIANVYSLRREPWGERGNFEEPS